MVRGFGLATITRSRDGCQVFSFPIDEALVLYVLLLSLLLGWSSSSMGGGGGGGGGGRRGSGVLVLALAFVFLPPPVAIVSCFCLVLIFVGPSARLSEYHDHGDSRKKWHRLKRCGGRCALMVLLS